MCCCCLARQDRRHHLFGFRRQTRQTRQVQAPLRRSAESGYCATIAAAARLIAVPRIRSIKGPTTLYRLCTPLTPHARATLVRPSSHASRRYQDRFVYRDAFTCNAHHLVTQFPFGIKRKVEWTNTISSPSNFASFLIRFCLIEYTIKNIHHMH